MKLTDYELWQIECMADGIYIPSLDKVLFPAQTVKNAFEAGAASRQEEIDKLKSSGWIEGKPLKKYANFLLKVKPKYSTYEHIVKAFYAEKLQIDVGYPDDDEDERYDKDEHDEYYLVPGYYEDSQWYTDESGYYRIPEEDIIAYQMIPKVSWEK
jgi:hypothetical protein